MTVLLVPYHLDEHLTDLDWPWPADHAVTVDLPAGNTWSRLARLYDRAADVIASQPDPVIMSGDCTTSLAVVAGLQRRGLAPSIVWFDAHGDVQTPETTASGYLGGMPLRLLVGYRPELITQRLGVTPVPEERTLLVGARDLDPPEVEYLAASRIRRCEVAELSVDLLPDGPIYLHVDLDVTSDVDLPGLRYPAGDGPSLVSVGDAVARVMGTGRVVATGIACTWWPDAENGRRVADALPRPA